MAGQQTTLILKVVDFKIEIWVPLGRGGARFARGFSVPNLGFSSHLKDIIKIY